MTARDVILKRRARFLAAATALLATSPTAVKAADGGDLDHEDASGTPVSVDGGGIVRDASPADEDGGGDAGVGRPEACLCAAVFRSDENQNVSGAAVTATIGVIAALRRKKRGLGEQGSPKGKREQGSPKGKGEPGSPKRKRKR